MVNTHFISQLCIVIHSTSGVAGDVVRISGCCFKDGFQCVWRELEKEEELCEEGEQVNGVEFERIYQNKLRHLNSSKLHFIKPRKVDSFGSLAICEVPQNLKEGMQLELRVTNDGIHVSDTLKVFSHTSFVPKQPIKANHTSTLLPLLLSLLIIVSICFIYLLNRMVGRQEIVEDKKTKTRKNKKKD